MDMIHMTCVLRESNNSQFDVYIYIVTIVHHISFITIIIIINIIIMMTIYNNIYNI